MGIGRPGGDYAQQLTEPGGWTDADEDQLYKVANEGTRALQQLTFSAFDPWQRERSETFDGGSWLGRAAGAAYNKSGKHSDEFVAQQNNLANAVEWNKEVAELVKKTKEAIIDNVEEAQRRIEIVKNLNLFGPLVDALIQAIAINQIITDFHGRNVKEIANTTTAIPAADTWRSPPGTLERLLNQKQPPATPAPTPTPDIPAPGSPKSDSKTPATGGQGGASSVSYFTKPEEPA
ncbi:hypothetical protein HGK73_23970, partial [Mycolicibacterium fortuitum]|nr:hypothetical protein [Mycolicibacterium fortuitum]